MRGISGIQYLHKFFACDRFLLIKILRNFIQLFSVFQQDLCSLFMLLSDKLYDLLVDHRLCLGGTGQ